MTLLVYCSYPVLDQSGEPEWVSRLESLLGDNGLSAFALYRPWVPLRAQSNIFPLLESSPHPFFSSNAALLQLPMEAMGSLGDRRTQNALDAADRAEPNNIIPFKDIFCLMRSHIVISDLSKPSYGETFRDVFMAHLAKIPIIGLTDRFMNSPIIFNMVDTVVPLSRLDVVLHQMVSYSLSYVREETTTKTGDLTTTHDVTQENTDHGTTVS